MFKEPTATTAVVLLLLLNGNVFTTNGKRA